MRKLEGCVMSDTERQFSHSCCVYERSWIPSPIPIDDLLVSLIMGGLLGQVWLYFVYQHDQRTLMFLIPIFPYIIWFHLRVNKGQPFKIVSSEFSIENEIETYVLVNPVCVFGNIDDGVSLNHMNSSYFLSTKYVRWISHMFSAPQWVWPRYDDIGLAVDWLTE